MSRPVPLHIAAGGPVLAADLYLPSTSAKPPPCVVMASGFGGVKEMLLPHFGLALAEAGIATLTLDYAGFGGSAGEPRQDLVPEEQIRDLRRGLDYLCGDSRVDPKRLGVFGPSMAGAHALVLAGTDSRVRATVSVVPFVRAAPTPPSARLGFEILQDTARRALGLPSKLVRAAGAPGSHAVMTDDGALQWIQKVSAQAPTFRNEITVRSLARLATYRPVRRLGPAGIHGPLRTILAIDDSITPAAAVHAELQGIEHDSLQFPGTHFELFGEHLPAVTKATVDWFREHLCGSDWARNDSSSHGRVERP